MHGQIKKCTNLLVHISVKMSLIKSKKRTKTIKEVLSMKLTKNILKMIKKNQTHKINSK